MARMGPRMGPNEGPNEGPYPKKLSPPVGFAWSPPFNVSEVAPRDFQTSLDTVSLIPATSTTLYVDVTDVGASDGNPGTSKSAPKKSIWSAKLTPSLIYVKGSADPSTPTLYPYDNGWRASTGGDTAVVVVSDFDTLAPGYAVSSVASIAGDSLLGTWSLVGGGTPNVYQATLAAAPYAVLDAAVVNGTTGVPTELTQQASVAAVEAAPGSWHHAAGVFYVRRIGSTPPDSDLRPLNDAINGHCSLAVATYVERLSFEGGGSRAFLIQNCTTASFVDCTFRHAKTNGCELNTGGMGLSSITHTVNLIGCRSIANRGGDGFGASVAGAGESIRWLEVGCQSNYNAGGSTQASSVHRVAGNGDVNVIRIGCSYVGNEAQEAADTGGSQAWMLGCSLDSAALGIGTGYTMADTGTAWFHGCTFSGSAVDLETNNAAGTINVYDTSYRTTSGAGTVQAYVP